MSTLEQQARSECPIVRTHNRFLLRSLFFTQQYAYMYRCRMVAQRSRALDAIRKAVQRSGDAIETPETLRLLELKPGVPAVCVGVLYKQMKLLPSFLVRYQKELIRLDAGDEDKDGEGDVGALAEEETVAAADLLDAETTEQVPVCCASDELLLEDSSGRIILEGLQTSHFFTGVVLGVYGTLSHNGRMQVLRYVLCGAEAAYVPRPLSPVKEPCYIAFVCGLNVRLPQDDDTPAVVQSRALVELLVDFISGNVSDQTLLTQSQRISRLVIGGNSIAATEELKLKKKVKLDPSDHVRLNDEKTTAGVPTSAKLMRHLDGVLQRLASSVEVELMPGDNDMSNAFQPQQPLHPVLLPQATRYSSLRLVTNPFEFVAATAQQVSCSEAAFQPPTPNEPNKSSEGVGFFVTSGQNVNDIVRQTEFASALDAMAVLVASGCACPTAPNTLFCYPFKDTEPFLFERTPHCLVACDQTTYETRYATLGELEAETSSYLTSSGTVSEEVVRASSGTSSTEGVRLVCVPSFERTGTIVLVNVNSPQLETTAITFSMGPQ